MQHLTQPIRTYFDKMQPGDTVTVSKAKDPPGLVEAAKEYIDECNPDLEFNNDYTIIKKLNKWEQ